MTMHNKERLVNKLLTKLISNNEHLCSKEELELIKRFAYHGEESLALDEFCAMWEVTKKPPLDEESYKIVEQLFELLELENDEMFGPNISRFIQSK